MSEKKCIGYYLLITPYTSKEINIHKTRHIPKTPVTL